MSDAVATVDTDVTIALGTGWVRCRCRGEQYQVGRRLGVWEVAVYDVERHGFVLGTSRTPEGKFATRREALTALLDWLHAKWSRS